MKLCRQQRKLCCDLSTRRSSWSWLVNPTLTRSVGAKTMIDIAGTESTAKSMALAHFHLLANPQIMARLRDEIWTVQDTASWTELEQLPYFNAVIAEANRLSFGVTARLCRITPDESFVSKGYAIPPGTPMSMTALCAHTDESHFPDPRTFDPDRWLGPESAKKRQYRMAFNKGSCIWIGMNLAPAWILHRRSCFSLLRLWRARIWSCSRPILPMSSSSTIIMWHIQSSFRKASELRCMTERDSFP
jgi:Cytochrome P450